MKTTVFTKITPKNKKYQYSYINSYIKDITDIFHVTILFLKQYNHRIIR